jgi:hypothetical protein
LNYRAIRFGIIGLGGLISCNFVTAVQGADFQAVQEKTGLSPELHGCAEALYAELYKACQQGVGKDLTDDSEAMLKELAKSLVREKPASKPSLEKVLFAQMREKISEVLGPLSWESSVLLKSSVEAIVANEGAQLERTSSLTPVCGTSTKGTLGTCALGVATSGDVHSASVKTKKPKKRKRGEEDAAPALSTCFSPVALGMSTSQASAADPVVVNRTRIKRGVPKKSNPFQKKRVVTPAAANIT